MTRTRLESELPNPEIERRRELRGITHGLSVTLLAPRAVAFDAVEASRRSFFVHVDDPDSYRLGEEHEARIAQGGRSTTARLEVIRKEIDPRRGVALRIAHIAPESEEALREILGPLAAPADRP